MTQSSGIKVMNLEQRQWMDQRQGGNGKSLEENEEEVLRWRSVSLFRSFLNGNKSC